MIRDRRFFTCEKNCGIFATIRDIRRDQYADRSDRLYQEEQKQIRESGLKEKDRIVWISDNGPEFGEVKWIGILPDSNRMDITVGVEFVRFYLNFNGIFVVHSFEMKSQYVSVKRDY